MLPGKPSGQVSHKLAFPAEMFDESSSQQLPSFSDSERQGLLSPSHHTGTKHSNIRDSPVVDAINKMSIPVLSILFTIIPIIFYLNESFKYFLMQFYD